MCVTFATDQIWRTCQFGSTSLFQCPWWTKHGHTEHVRFTVFNTCTDYFHNSSRTDIPFFSSRFGVVVRKIPTYSLLLDALYPPPACPVSHHFNTPQWPTVSCINPLLIYTALLSLFIMPLSPITSFYTLYSFHSLFNSGILNNCEKSIEYNGWQWHIEPLHLSIRTLYSFTVCSMETQFRQRCVLHGHGRELDCMSDFDTWTASPMMHRTLLVVLSLSSGPVWFQGNGKLTNSLYVDIVWPMTFTFIDISSVFSPLWWSQFAVSNPSIVDSNVENRLTQTAVEGSTERNMVCGMCHFDLNLEMYLFLDPSNFPWCSYGGSTMASSSLQAF